MPADSGRGRIRLEVRANSFVSNRDRGDRSIVPAALGSDRDRECRNRLDRLPSAIRRQFEFAPSHSLGVHRRRVLRRDAGERRGYGNGNFVCALTFTPLPAPGLHEIASVAQRIRDRVLKWAKRRRVTLGALFDDAAMSEDPIAQLVRIGASAGRHATLAPHGRPVRAEGNDTFSPRKTPAMSVAIDNFNVHAGVAVAAWDREARERLLRYCTRPPFSLERLSVLPDGRIAYRTKHPGPRGHTHRIMEPLEFMARLAALVPPPRAPLVRYAGVLAPNSPKRPNVVPRSERSAAHGCLGASGRARGEPGHAPRTPSRAADAETRAPPDGGALVPDLPATESGGITLTPSRTIAAGLVEPARSTRAHGRAYIDWSSLLRRIHSVDALACSRCAGRLEVIAVLNERAAIERVLAHLGESPTGPPPRRICEPWVSDPP